MKSLNRFNGLENKKIPNIDNQITELVNKLCGGQNYVGEHPFEIRVVSNDTAFFIKIRKTENYITIQQQEIENPNLVKTYEFNKENNNWKYIDTSKLKYNVSSKNELQIIFERLKNAVDNSNPKEIENNK
ncbi:MAG: hypothetical protein WCO35_03705 [Candidatus Nomurabacteria bacterium]